MTPNPALIADVFLLLSVVHPAVMSVKINFSLKAAHPAVILILQRKKTGRNSL